MTFSVDDFARALESQDFNFEIGHKVTGNPFSLTKEGIYVDIGGKAAAFLPLKEISLSADQDPTDQIPLERSREFLIIKGQDADGQVVLSVRQLEIKALWQQLQGLEAHETIQVRVTGTNKGGVTADYKGIRGFIPRSHLIDRENLDALVGQKLDVSFLEVDPDRKKLVLSQRLATQSSRVQAFEVNDLVTGIVRDLKPFGVFIDLDGITGLLHIQQVSNKYISSLDQVFKRGDTVKSVVIDIDPQRGRISLSTKVLENRPGEMLDSLASVMEDAEARAHKYLDKVFGEQ